MYTFVAVILGLFAFLMVGTGLWILFFGKQVNVSSLRRYFLLGPWLTALKSVFGLEFRESYLKGWRKNLLGLFLLIAGLAIFYAIWFVINSRLIVI